MYPSLDPIISQRWADVRAWAREQPHEYHPLYFIVEAPTPAGTPDPGGDTTWSMVLRLAAEMDGCPHSDWVLAQADLVDVANRFRFRQLAVITIKQIVETSSGKRVEVPAGVYATDERLGLVVQDSPYYPAWYPSDYTVEVVKSARRQQTRRAPALLAVLALWAGWFAVELLVLMGEASTGNVLTVIGAVLLGAVLAAFVVPPAIQWRRHRKMVANR